ncbi:MAG: hypothetical protein ACI8RD_000797 [Bacillariaceae sp.]|jgi:hypothetical protein
MKIIITTFIIIGSLIQSTDAFVTNPNRNSAAAATTTSNTVSPRWASTLDKKDVEEEIDTSNKINDNNSDHSSDNDNDNDSNKDGTSFGERITNSGVASAAAMATVSTIV